MTSKRLMISMVLVALWAITSPAEVVESHPGGFLVSSQVMIGATPESVYAALTGQVHRWWDSAHTFSGDAGNLSMEAQPGGCFCEALPGGGGVRHMTVVYADPGKVLRLAGGLGPLQGFGVAGSLTFAMAAVADSTRLSLDYTVGGYCQGGLHGIAPAVDMVLYSQIERLGRFVETGDPKS